MTSFLELTVQINGNRIVTFRGRIAWTLTKLLAAGDGGFTVFDTRAPRLSGYIYFLRRSGIDVRAEREFHGGRFPGRHARYELLCRRPKKATCGYSSAMTGRPTTRVACTAPARTSIHKCTPANESRRDAPPFVRMLKCA
jgi:hypothetical protein